METTAADLLCKTGADHLASLRDGRAVSIDGDPNGEIERRTEFAGISPNLDARPRARGECRLRRGSGHGTVRRNCVSRNGE